MDSSNGYRVLLFWRQLAWQELPNVPERFTGLIRYLHCTLRTVLNNMSALLEDWIARGEDWIGSLHKLDKSTMQQCFKVGDEVSLYNPKLASRRRSVFPEGGPFDRPSMPRLRRQRPLLIFFPEGVQHLDLLAPSRAVIRICGWCSWIDK